MKNALTRFPMLAATLMLGVSFTACQGSDSDSSTQSNASDAPRAKISMVAENGILMPVVTVDEPEAPQTDMPETSVDADEQENPGVPALPMEPAITPGFVEAALELTGLEENTHFAKAGQFEKEGIELVDIAPDSMWAQLGLQNGDIMHRINGKRLELLSDVTEQLVEIIEKTNPNKQKIKIKFYRNGVLMKASGLLADPQ